jgi:hypothetical protein
MSVFERREEEAFDRLERALLKADFVKKLNAKCPELYEEFLEVIELYK